MKKKEGCQAQGFSCERKIKEKHNYLLIFLTIFAFVLYIEGMEV